MSVLMSLAMFPTDTKGSKSKEVAQVLEIVGQSGMECKLYHKKLNMSFMCDGIIKYKSKYFIFEFKTETANKW